MKRVKWAIPLLGLLLALLLAAGCTVQFRSVKTSQPQQPPPAATSTLADAGITWLQMVDAKAGWALGSGGILRTTDGGRHWEAVTPPKTSVPANSGSDFSTAYFLNGQAGWVVTTHGGGDNDALVLRTADGGESWDTFTGPKAGRVYINFTDAAHGWMLTDQYGVAMGSEPVAVYTTTDGGKDWALANKTDPSAQKPDGSLPFPGVKSGITFRDASTGWVTADLRTGNQVWLYRTGDGGHTWQAQAVPVPAAFRDRQMRTCAPRFFDTKNGVLPVTLTPGYDTIFYQTRDGGLTWAATAPVKSKVSSVGQLVWDFVDPSHGWATDGVTLFATTDGGQTWKTLTPAVSLTSVQQLDFVTDQTGWAVLEQSGTTLLQTTDGGVTWSPPGH